VNSIATGLAVPKLTPGGTSTFLLEGTVTPESCQFTDAGGPIPSLLGTIVPFQQSQTDATVANVGGSAAGVDAFDLELKADTVTGRIGATELLPFVSPDPSLHYAAGNATGVTNLQSWFTTFLVWGQDLAADERSAVVSLHSGGVTLTFGGVGIARLDPEERQSDGAYRASLYADTLAFGGADTQ